MNSNPSGRGRFLSFARGSVWCLVLLGFVASGSAGAAGQAGAVVLAEPDASAVRKLVQDQLDAFAAEDAERAFSYASVSIQTQFGNANQFMAMVRRGYPMVVRPASATFFQALVDEAAAAPQSGPQSARQAVQLRDREGRLWTATYVLERQPGAGWRINGCVVAADSGKSLT